MISSEVFESRSFRIGMILVCFGTTLTGLLLGLRVWTFFSGGRTAFGFEFINAEA